jgi:hypothetical protein
MSRSASKNLIGLIGILTLAFSAASCGSTANLGYEPQPEAGAATGGGIDEPSGPEARSASYTPGLPCIIGAGMTNPNVLKYGWKWWDVSESSFPRYVQLVNPGNAVPRIQYQFQESQFGRLQSVAFDGSGSGVVLSIYNYSTGTWNKFGPWDFANGAIGTDVLAAHCQQGKSLVRLILPAAGTVRITSCTTIVY